MDKLVKHIPDETVEILTRRAQSLGLNNVSALIRMLLIQEARKIQDQEKEERREEEKIAQN